MGKLQYFNKSSYNSLSEALGDIRKELQALQPENSKSAVWSRSAHGMSVNLIANATPQGTNSPTDETSGEGIILLELVSVPPQGYGNGTAKRIIGYTETGGRIYDKQEIPVRIPKL